MPARGRETLALLACTRALLRFQNSTPPSGILLLLACLPGRGLTSEEPPLSLLVSVALYVCWKPDMPACCEKIECAYAQNHVEATRRRAVCSNVIMSRGSHKQFASALSRLRLQYASACARDTCSPCEQRRRRRCRLDRSKPGCVAPAVQCWPGLDLASAVYKVVCGRPYHVTRVVQAAWDVARE